MVQVGGLRVRLVFDSLYNMINDSLTSLGWFDGGREHLPIQFLAEPVDEDTEIPLNTLVLSGEDIFTADLEMGGPYAQHTRSFFVDFYAEGHSLGEHVIFDIRDILQGRMASIGRTGPVFTIFDYTLGGPPTIGVGDINDVFVDRAHVLTKPWQKHWWSCAFTVDDAYGNEAG